MASGGGQAFLLFYKPCWTKHLRNSQKLLMNMIDWCIYISILIRDFLACFCLGSRRSCAFPRGWALARSYEAGWLHCVCFPDTRMCLIAAQTLRNSRVLCLDQHLRRYSLCKRYIWKVRREDATRRAERNDCGYLLLRTISSTSTRLLRTHARTTTLSRQAYMTCASITIHNISF